MYNMYNVYMYMCEAPYDYESTEVVLSGYAH